jgi:hypothetical protein
VQDEKLLESNPDFFVECAESGVVSLISTGHWAPHVSERLHRGDVDELVLNYTNGFSQPDLDFVEDWPIRSLKILDRRLRELGPITRLTSLEELSVEAAPGTQFDVSVFRRIRTLSGVWDAFRRSFAGLDTLKELIAINFRDPDLSVLAESTGLNRLVLKGARALRSLDGIEACAGLRELEIVLGQSLPDIDAISSVRNSLQILFFDTCRRVDRIDCVQQLSELRVLGIANCQYIESLKPLRGLAHLEALYAWESTHVRDCDLTPLEQLPELHVVRLKNRNGYVPTAEEIEALLARRPKCD